MRAMMTHEPRTARGPPPIESQIDARAEFDDFYLIFLSLQGLVRIQRHTSQSEFFFRNLTVFIRPQTGKIFNLHHAP